MVREHHPGYRLVLVGGSFGPFAERELITATGRVTDRELAALYRAAACLVQPSLEEGFGLPPLEAMASGTAVVVSRIPSLVEVTGGAAIEVDPLSARSIADGIGRAVEDRPLRDALVAHGLARASELTWRRCAEVTLAAYRRALE
jgi:glycosyltransferase involved in cell wall biosynthesis